MAKLDETVSSKAATAEILRRNRDTRRHSLSELEHDGTYHRVAIERAETILGRDPEAHIKLASKRASRHHATLRLQGMECVLTDNDSRHGILLNGVRVHSAVLRDGDVIQAGDDVFVYHEE